MQAFVDMVLEINTEDEDEASEMLIEIMGLFDDALRNSAWAYGYIEDEHFNF